MVTNYSRIPKIPNIFQTIIIGQDYKQRFQSNLYSLLYTEVTYIHDGCDSLRFHPRRKTPSNPRFNGRSPK